MWSFHLNINKSGLKDSIVYTSGCKYLKVNFDPHDKDDTYMTLTRSSKKQYLDECNGQRTEKEDSNVSFIFYYIVNNELYYMFCFCP